jgi:hypothetical protein
MAEPAVEQNGQKCALLLPVLRSAQKWNCAARKIKPSNRAHTFALFVWVGIPTGIVGRKIRFMSNDKWAYTLLEGTPKTTTPAPTSQACISGHFRPLQLSAPCRLDEPHDWEDNTQLERYFEAGEDANAV